MHNADSYQEPDYIQRVKRCMYLQVHEQSEGDTCISHCIVSCPAAANCSFCHSQHMNSNRQIEKKQENKQDISSRFRNVFMIFIKGKDKIMKAVEHQTYDAKHECRPGSQCKYPAAATSPVKICHYETRPCQHSQNHKDEISDRIDIYNCKHLRFVVISVKNAPSYLSKIEQVRCMQKMAVADFHVMSRILRISLGKNDTDIFPVQY